MRKSLKEKIAERFKKIQIDRQKKEQSKICPHCRKKLNYFSGLETMPAGLYCPDCNNAIYDEEKNILCKLE